MTSPLHSPSNVFDTAIAAAGSTRSRRAPVKKRAPTKISPSFDASLLPANKWFLGFDCATKTFAFGLVKLDLAGFWAKRDYYFAAARRLETMTEKERTAFRQELRKHIFIADGAVVDLFPGRADKSIGTVERVTGLVRYVEETVKPRVKKICGTSPVEVVVEYQMGHNFPARAVANAIIARFCAHHTVRIVGPALKNRIALLPGCEWGVFRERSGNNYLANKAHASHNFRLLEKMYGSAIPSFKLPGKSEAESRGHIADSVLQILGHVEYGDDNADKY